MLILPGSNALSAFRARRLLSALQETDPAITGVDARYLHFVDGGESLSQNALARLSSLLTYGDPYPGDETGDEYVVVPRFGTISPWSSKATDIAHDCGLDDVKRVERGISYRIRRAEGAPLPTDEGRREIMGKPAEFIRFDVAVADSHIPALAKRLDAMQFTPRDDNMIRIPERSTTPFGQAALPNIQPMHMPERVTQIERAVFGNNIRRFLDGAFQFP